MKAETRALRPRTGGRWTSFSTRRVSGSRLASIRPRPVARSPPVRSSSTYARTTSGGRAGVVPGSLHIPRLVLEWRVDPESGHANPHVTGLDCHFVLFCAEGFASSFAAADLRELGCVKATDMIGGFEAWKAAGLPVRPADDRDLEPGELAGMRPPEPLE